MTANLNPIDVPAVLEQLQRAEPDLLRSMLAAFVQALMSAEADAVCGAEYGSRSPDRSNRRNGYRHRDWDTRAGTIELAIPKLREGSYFPDWLLERRRRAESALVSVVATRVTCSAEDGAGWLGFFRDLTPRACPGSPWSPPTHIGAWSTPSAPP